MQEPKHHSKIDPFLPEGHWLEEYFETHAEFPDSRRLFCNECGFLVYDAELGTVMTWMETGWLFRDHEGVEAWHPCIWCYGNQDGQVGLTTTQGVINPAFALTDDGGPQPQGDPESNNVVEYERLAGQPPIPKELR